MQPAGILNTVMAAAAVATAPQQPLIEVFLNKWHNKTNSAVEFCTLVKVSPLNKLVQKPPLAVIEPWAQDNLNMLIYSVQNHTSSFCSHLRAQRVAQENAYVTFQFNFYDFGAFQIACVLANKNNESTQTSTLLDECIRWDQDQVPSYIMLEIDGTIMQEDLRNTTFKVTRVKKEKLY